MGGITTPALAILGATAPGSGLINRAVGISRTAAQADDLLGISKSRRKKRERELLSAEQAAESADLTARQADDLETLRRRNQGEAARIQAESRTAERRRQRTLRQEAGRTRAQLGAQGIGAADGSGEAILLGQATEAEEERRDAARLDALRLAALSDEETALQRRNLLDLTRQQERQRLERLTRGA